MDAMKEREPALLSARERHSSPVLASLTGVRARQRLLLFPERDL
jgi:hypothetical protein